ncbi:MAG: ATP-binding cassette domain-containing protein, partial [Limisphaerales bacterium]
MTEHAPQPTSVLLNASGLRKRYTVGRKLIDVLKGVDLEVLTGEFLSIVGASGSGKSTLLHLLGGLDQPDGGNLQVQGQDLTAMA